MITDQTTLAELQLEAGKRGITFISVKTNSLNGMLAGLQVHHGESWEMGEGATVAEAIAVAFDRLDRKIGKQLVKPLPNPSTVGPRR